MQTSPSAENQSFSDPALTPFPEKSPYVSLEVLTYKLVSLGLDSHGLVIAALKQAQQSHASQLRDNGGSYLEEHIYPVTYSVIDHEAQVGHRVSAKLVATALTHDVPEDDPSMPLSSFRVAFGGSSTQILKPGRSVADLVAPLTKSNPEDFEGKDIFEQRAGRDAAYHAALLTAEYETQIVKLADRCMNIFSLHLCSPDKIVRKIRETEEFYLPLAREVSPIYFNLMSKRIEKLKDWLAH